MLGCAILHLSQCGSLELGLWGCVWVFRQNLDQTTCSNTQTSLLRGNGRPGLVQKSCLPFHSLRPLLLKMALCWLERFELTGDVTCELLSSVTMTIKVFFPCILIPCLAGIICVCSLISRFLLCAQISNEIQSRESCNSSPEETVPQNLLPETTASCYPFLTPSP